MSHKIILLKNWIAPIKIALIIFLLLLLGFLGHDFLIWKVKRRVEKYKPKPACCCKAESAPMNTNVYRYDYYLVPQLYFIVCIIYECYLSKV